MMSEIFLSITVLFLTLQSTFWCSLLTVPLAILAILAIQQTLKFSGMIVFIFSLVFVGGLLLLIVMVSTLSHQESNLLLTVPLAILATSMVTLNNFMSVINMEMSDKMSFMFWFEKTPSMLSLPLLSLFFSLILVSIFFSNSKMMSRII